MNKLQMKDLIRNNYNKTGIYDMNDVQRKHTGYFFSKGAMRFFNSRLTNILYCSENKAFFVTSEKFDHNSKRFYTVRYLDINSGKIETVGEFNELSRAKADSLALNSAYNDTVEQE